MFLDRIRETDRLIQIIRQGAGQAMTDREFLQREIVNWKSSPHRQLQIQGDEYYEGRQEILHKKRTAIGRDGKLTEITNLPNNRILDNQYAIHVDRKTNYIAGKPFIVSTEDDNYKEALKEVFDRSFMRKMKSVTKECMNGGIAWMYPYYGDDSKLKFKVFPGFECLPFWKDSEHTELDMLVRLYPVEVYDGKQKKTIDKIEVYSLEGIKRYVMINNQLVDDVDEPTSPYFYLEEDDISTAQNWERIPVVPFKYNDREKPLLADCKGLQDAINTMQSAFADNMQNDQWSTILVIKNYDGENLGEFRQNLATYGAVKVRSDAGGDGGIDTLNVEVNAANYETILNILKKKLIENARSFDAKDDRIGSNANQMNLKSMYSDIDLDADGMETEFQAGMEQLMWFIDAYLSHIGKGDFSNVGFEIQFDRNIMMNESDIIANIKNSIGVVSNETLVEKHPFVEDVEKELNRIQEEKTTSQDAFFEEVNEE